MRGPCAARSQRCRGSRRYEHWGNPPRPEWQGAAGRMAVGLGGGDRGGIPGFRNPSGRTMRGVLKASRSCSACERPDHSPAVVQSLLRRPLAWPNSVAPSYSPYRPGSRRIANRTQAELSSATGGHPAHDGPRQSFHRQSRPHPRTLPHALLHPVRRADLRGRLRPTENSISTGI